MIKKNGHLKKKILKLWFWCKNLQKETVLSHCFHLNLTKDNPEVHEIDGVINAYQNCLQNIELYGPTVIFFNF